MGVITIPPIDRSSDLVPRRSGNRGDILIAQGIQPPVFTSPDKVVTPVVSKAINEDILAGDNITIDHGADEKITISAVSCPWEPGDILTTINPENPSIRWPGTEWEPFAEGRTIVGVGNNGTTNYTTPGAVAGADNVTLNPSQIANHAHTMNHTHTIAHSHGVSIAYVRGSDVNRYSPPNGSGPYDGASHAIMGYTHSQDSLNSGAASDSSTGNTGGGTPHENRMPLQTAYVWIRTS